VEDAAAQRTVFHHRAWTAAQRIGSNAGRGRVARHQPPHVSGVEGVLSG
jgi:hypothetical protein